MRRLIVAAMVLLAVTALTGCATPKPIKLHDGRWQQHQDVKMRACYEVAETQAEANACLLELNVFI